MDMKKPLKNTVTEIYTQSSLKITWKMPVHSHDLELPGMERPWFYQNINNQLHKVQKQQEGGTSKLRTQLHLTQVVFHVRGSSGLKVKERAE
jgi:hypothetical protein